MRFYFFIEQVLKNVQQKKVTSYGRIKETAIGGFYAVRKILGGSHIISSITESADPSQDRSLGEAAGCSRALGIKIAGGISGVGDVYKVA